MSAQDLIPLVLGVYAALVSTVLAVRQLRADRPRLRVRCWEISGKRPPSLEIRATNVRATPVEIRHVGFKASPWGASSVSKVSAKSADSLPHFLGHGESCSFRLTSTTPHGQRAFVEDSAERKHFDRDNWVEAAWVAAGFVGVGAIYYVLAAEFGSEFLASVATIPFGIGVVLAKIHRDRRHPITRPKEFNLFGIPVALGVAALVAHGIHTLFSTPYEPPAGGINAGYRRAPPAQLSGARISSTEEARSFFEVADDEQLSNYAIVPRDIETAGLSSPEDLRVVICPESVSQCGPATARAAVFRLCHLHQDERTAGAEDSWSFAFAPTSCLRPIGRNSLKFIYRKSTSSDPDWGVVFGPVDDGFEIGPNELAGPKGFGETALAEDILNERTDDRGAAWARAHGIATSTTTTSPLDRR